MVAITKLFMFATAAMAAVLPRDAAQTLKDLQTIDTDTNKLTSTTNSWDGSVFGAAPIQNQAKQVGTDIDNANTNAKGVSASSADSKKIISYITGTLEPDVKKSLNAIVAKKAQFQKAGLYSTVKDTLASLRSKTQSLSSTLVAGASSDQKSAGQAAAKTIDNDFANAQAQFP